MLHDSTEGQVKLNPSYDKTKSPATRFNDFLGKYHIQLNGTTPHEPFELKDELRVGRCDGEYKEAIIDFVLKHIIPDVQDRYHDLLCSRIDSVGFKEWIKK